jgi:hypothetical protein
MVEVKAWFLLPICVAAFVAAWRLQSRVSDLVTDARHLAECYDSQRGSEVPGWPQRVEKQGESAKGLALALVLMTAFLSLTFAVSLLPYSSGSGPGF